MGKYIRWANEDDAESLVTLNAEFNGAGLKVSEIKHSLRNTNELVALAIMEDVPVGFACAQFNKSFCYRDLQREITEMYIQEAARRKGLGSMLLLFLEQELQVRGVKDVKILTGRNNESAHKAYEHANYLNKDQIVFEKQLTSRI
ncbi:MAG: GNAT family N-acetyltransferase [Paenibacillaceae bacterium]